MLSEMRCSPVKVGTFTNNDVYKNLYEVLQLISRSARCAPSVPDFVWDTSPVNGGGKPSSED
jgi:hypothetical protein